MSSTPLIVDRALVGFVPGVASPTDRPERLGSARLSPEGPFKARAFAAFALTYTVGHHGVDDRGAMKLVFRFPADWGELQFSDPKAANYVSVESSRGSDFRLRYEGFGGSRPWFKELIIKVVGGCLREGDEVVIRLGDDRQGSPGLKLQTFCEEAWELRLLVDPCATGHFVEVPDTLAVSIVPGPPVRWKALLPTRREIGAVFSLGIVAEDLWGNPSDQVDQVLTLVPSVPVEGLPETVHFAPGQRALRLDGLTAAPGLLRIAVRDAAGGLLVESNPLILDDAVTFWGDLHGQTGETVGVNSAESYFLFARDLAFLDITSHQGNAFQINRHFWARLNELTQRFDEPGRFLAIPGYEWSGNTGVGGDRNVYFRNEGALIRRSSHALITDMSDVATDCTTAASLFASLAGEDAVAYAHVGGRWADIRLAHDGRVERSMEIHSAWGTFEWLLHDAFDLGHRVGVVANSDGHKGRPGASYPGASTFGAYGGLTCFKMDALDRDALFDCLRRRHHYATSGARVDLEVVANFQQPATVFDDDPRLGATGSRRSLRATMGDVVQCVDDPEITVKVAADSPIERIELRSGREVLRTWRPYGEAQLGRRLRIVCEGANYRGRGRQVLWRVTAKTSSVFVERAERFNAWNPERRFDVRRKTIDWEAVTTGNHCGVDLWMDRELDGGLVLENNFGREVLQLVDLGVEDVAFDYEGLGRGMRVFRLPDVLEQREADFTTGVPVAPTGDTPVWVCVTLESGHQAWSSPIYLTREAP